jgi:cyclopropane fatty-acyl-phospholipid synthase-like methyltransferase
MLKSRARALKQSLLLHRHHGHSESGIALPPVSFRMGGTHFSSDEAFVRSADADVQRLEQLVGLNKNSRVLDWGCGAGRLAVGVAERHGRIELYHGVDVQKHLIDWADSHIGVHDGYRFTHVDSANARYNPNGTSEMAIPGDTGDYDIFYAYSVFSHLSGPQVRHYLREVARVLRQDGLAFFTAFVEDDVPAEEENPLGYGPGKASGALHCVRFETSFFAQQIKDAGLLVTRFEHGHEADGQSLYIVGKDRTAS